RCAVHYCGSLIGKATKGSTIETKCSRCYAFTLWADVKARLTRPPRRVRTQSGAWVTLESTREIEELMEEGASIDASAIQRRCCVWGRAQSDSLAKGVECMPKVKRMLKSQLSGENKYWEVRAMSGDSAENTGELLIYGPIYFQSW